jgi:hypothetical protein
MRIHNPITSFRNNSWSPIYYSSWKQSYMMTVIFDFLATYGYSGRSIIDHNFTKQEGNGRSGRGTLLLCFPPTITWRCRSEKNTWSCYLSLSFCKVRDSLRGRELGGIVSFFKQNKNWYVATCSTIKIFSGDRIFLFFRGGQVVSPKIYNQFWRHPIYFRRKFKFFKKTSR